jgi:hypothetical protein
MEQRREPRIPKHVRFFIHVHECEEDPDMVGTSVTCEAVDFSIHGLQFKTDAQLYRGSLLDITIGIGAPFGMYLLRGEIRWVKQEEDEDDFYMGILLLDEEHMDLDKWVETFDDTFSGEQAPSE